jgi:hypothetical protein
LPNTIDNDYLKWNFGVLEPGETEEIDLTMLVSQDAACGSSLTNKAKYFSDQTCWGNFIEEETLVVCEEPPVYQCSDDLDNDGDDLIDEEDPGCHSDGNPDNPDSYVPTDDDEYNGPVNEGDVVINELMWMGSAGSIVDEWIELRNMTDSPVNLSGCELTKKDGVNDVTMLVIPSGESISKNGLYLISNYAADNANSNLDVNNLVNTAVSLSNTELQIKLYCGGYLIDTAGDGGDPLNMAGDKVDPKKSMSRKVIITDGDLADSWCIAVTQENWDAEAEELGTPGAPNVCNLVSGYKFSDKNNEGNWDSGEPGINGWEIKLYDDIDLTNLIASTFTKIYKSNLGHYIFKNLIAGTYFVKEENRSGWQQTFPTSPSYHEVIISEENPISEDNNFGNYEEPTPPYCGDGICNNNENCSTCPADCGSCGGGGVIVKPTIIITNEKVVYLGGGEALVTWTTNIETTRQVAYGDDSIDTENLGDAPGYGYDSVNEESTDGMIRDHSVKISGLTDGVTYYFRPIADRSGSTGEVVGIEVFYEPGEVKGAEVPAPTPEPAECNYLLEYIKLGADNNPIEVKKLEWFLNEFEGESLAVNGIYEQVDFDAVSRFQEKYMEDILTPWNHNKATGYVYITTKKKINELYCEREFPLTSEQEAEVAAFSARFLGAPATGDGAFDLTDDPESPTVEDFERGEVGGAETEADEEFVEMEKEEDERPQEIKIELEDGDKDEEENEGKGIIAALSNYSRYILIILALIILALAYRAYNSRKTKGEDIQ